MSFRNINFHCVIGGRGRWEIGRKKTSIDFTPTPQLNTLFTPYSTRGRLLNSRTGGCIQHSGVQQAPELEKCYFWVLLGFIILTVSNKTDFKSVHDRKKVLNVQNYQFLVFVQQLFNNIQISFNIFRNPLSIYSTIF